MVSTISGMAKSEQVRIPTDLARDARMVAAALGETLPEYTARVLREAVNKDMAKALRVLASRAEELKGQKAGSDRGS